MYVDAMTNGIKGITRPKGAIEDWRPSFMDMLRHGEIALAFERRNERALQSSYRHYRQGDERFSPTQRQQLDVLREHLLQRRRT
ncbi:hypothetical protein X566_15360 [Afipia sp. P52-10]|nr:hypothetical protein X566_15360 [Afipia sp. P52-10]